MISKRSKGLSGEEVYDCAMYGGVCHRTLTTHKSWNKMKRKKKIDFVY